MRSILRTAEDNGDQQTAGRRASSLLILLVGAAWAGIATLGIVGPATAQDDAFIPGPRVVGGSQVLDCPTGFVLLADDLCTGVVSEPADIAYFESLGADCSTAIDPTIATPFCSVKPGLPFMGILIDPGKRYCGATLIAADWVMTAAHCIDGADNITDLVVFIGPNGVERQVKAGIMHPRFDPVSFNFDVALLQIDPILVVDQAAPIKLATKSKPIGETATLAGFGRTGPTQPPSPGLFSVEVPVLPNNRCYSGVPLSTTEPFQLCAGTATATNCFGDSGGPLFQVDSDGIPTQIAIVSTAGFPDCASPASYTDVAVVNGWIVHTIFLEQLFADVECVGGNGLVSAEFVNGSLVEQTFRFTLAGFERSAIVGPGASGRVAVSGRPDGDFVVGPADASSWAATMLTVDCDPDGPEISVSSICLSGNGLVEVVIINPTGTELDYQVRVGTVTPRTVAVQAGEATRVRVSGRPDGATTVGVRRGALDLPSQSVSVDCDPDPVKGATISLSCLAGNGRVDVHLANLTASTAEYAVSVGTLDPRTQTLQPEQYKRVSVTGRPNGPLAVVVSRDGSIIASEILSVSC